MKIKYIGTALFFDRIVLPPDVLNKITKEKDWDALVSDHIGADKFKADYANLPGRTWQEKHWAYSTDKKLHWLRKVSSNDWNQQKSDPVKLELLIANSVSYWIFQDSVVSVSDENLYQTEDIKNHIKLFIYKRGDKFTKVSREVERFEKFEKIRPIQREQLPEDVRMFVWRRDNGKCVTCGSNRNLEFDHIIPVSEGGSNTERNIQLLCADCNKKKSNKI